MSNEIQHVSECLQEQEVNPGLVIAVDFLLPCGHRVTQALRQEEIIPRYQVDAAITAAADKLSYWMTRQAFPYHDCNLVTEANPNGFPVLSRNEVH